MESQTGHARAGSREAVEVLLLDPHVQRAAGDGHAQQIAIKLDAALRAPHGHGRVIDAEKQICTGLFPDRVALAFRKPEQFQVMPVRIAELDGFDAGGGRIRNRNRLRPRRNLPDMVAAQAHPGRVHVPHDDGDVLEPQVIAIRRHGNQPDVRRREELDELQRLLAELHRTTRARTPKMPQRRSYSGPSICTSLTFSKSNTSA